MKKRLLLYTALIACTSVMYSSCGKVASLIQALTISWTSTDVNFDVPVITDTTNFASIGSGTFTYNLDSLIKDKSSNQLGLSNIDNFTLTSCTLTILNPDASNNCANIVNAEGDVSSSANATVATIGSVSNNPDTYSATLSVPVNTTTNLKSYISPTGTTTFNYSVKAKLRRPTTTVLHATMHVEYSIHVTP